MADPIEAHYTLDGDEWTVAVQGRGRTLTGRAPGLIAARDMADQLVTQLTPEESGRKTVVHMLNGDAVEFTTAYLTARLARTEDPPAAEETNEDQPNPDAPKGSTEADEPTEPGKGDEHTRAKAPAEADAPGQADEPADALAEADKPADDLGEATKTAEAAETPAEPGPNAEDDAPHPATSTKAGPEAATKPTPTPRAESPTTQPAPAEETAHSST
ncbi:hypothetical protein [Actinophytocola sp.]|uniref:hypothetical protein n=1 Tax=Actinophytocola sp. TaxID=1872138 RepID=UPI002D50A559|nr:hypothetical protein [Actinophytocola sp.]HYQ62636.1 hypothetical protein [Actinophytocola sp.]